MQKKTNGAADGQEDEQHLSIGIQFPKVKVNEDFPFGGKPPKARQPLLWTNRLTDRLPLTNQLQRNSNTATIGHGGVDALQQYVRSVEKLSPLWRQTDRWRR